MGEANMRRAAESEPQGQAAAPNDDSVDRWDRRFRIEGDVIEALKVVVSGRSPK